MAENVEWIVDIHSPEATFVVWAHNGHVGRRPGMMGQYLADAYDSGYTPIAMTFGVGTYRALGPGGLANHVAGPSSAGGLEAALAEVRLPVFGLDLRRTEAQPDAAWLRATRPIRAVGGRASNLDVPTNVAEEFDGVIYVQSSTPTRELPRRP